MSSQVRHTSDGNAVHSCLLGTRLTHKLRRSVKLTLRVVTMQICAQQIAVCQN